ncbi:MAG: flagellar motor stator protein MotA [Pseudomonadota bacterium]
MGSIVGVLITFAMVFGGYLIAGGKMGIILSTLPYEMMMIGGAAVGAFIVANDGATIKHTMKDLGKAVKGPKWTRDDYTDLLSLMFELLKCSRSDPMALEQHIENHEESELFGKYPKIQADGRACEMICDTLRAASMNFDDPHQVEEVLEKQLEAGREHSQHSSHALQTMADGLPALGIVAAVLGVIKTMGSIDQPPEVLGKMIGGALVGTFLGVFLAYGVVGPFASRVGTVNESDEEFYSLIRDILVANLQAHPPATCVEVARQNVPRALRPKFAEVEETLKELKKATT